MRRNVPLPLFVVLSGCLINVPLYRERSAALAEGDADTDTDTDTDTTTGDTGPFGPFDRDGDGYTDDVDCNDAVASIHPGACEACEDGVDDNCSGGDAACHSPIVPGFNVASSGIRYTGVAAFDNAGIAVASAGDFDGDGMADLVMGASLADPGGLDGAGSTYLLLSPIVVGSSLGAANARLDGDDPQDRSGVAVAGLDVDSDGFSDLVVGARGHSATGERQGATYLVYGHPPPVPALGNLGTIGATLLGSPYSEAGTTLAGVGDIDGQPGEDLLIGAEHADHDKGLVYVLSGATTRRFPTGSVVQLAGEASRIEGDRRADLFGSALGKGGDIDGDGLSDMLIGAHHQRAVGEKAGAAYIVWGDPRFVAGSVFDVDDVATVLVGESPQDRAGVSVAAGDVDGDGRNDVLVGARQQNSRGTQHGAAYLFHATEVPQRRASLSEAQAKLFGENTDRLGQAVAVPGDIDCDGFDDVLVGADFRDDKRGAAYVLYGPFSGDITVATHADVVAMAGTGVGDRFGAYLTAAGDIDQDGRPEMLIGAWRADNGAGHAWVVFGSN